MAIFYAELSSPASSRWRVLLAFFLLLFTSRAFANEGSELIPLSLEKRIQQADVVVEGEVIAKQAFWDARHENIYTSNILKVYKVFKGQVSTGQAEVITLGGAIGLQVHVSSTALKLHEGQQGIFFLKKGQQLQRTPAAGTGLSAQVYGAQQGFIKYDVARHTASDVFNTYATVQELYKAVTTKTGTSYRTIAINELLHQATQNQQQATEQQAVAAAITSFSPTVTSAGTNTVLVINGSGFGNSRRSGFVEFRNADDGGQTWVTPLASDYISWSDNQIRLRIPSAGADGGTAGSGEIRVTPSGGNPITSTQKITLQFAYLNINESKRAFKPSLADVDGDGGYTIHFAPSMQSNNAAQEGFRRAMNTWVCITTVNWKIGAPTNVDKVAEDDLNVILFTSDLEAGVLASTLSRYKGCLVDNDTVWWVDGFDMEINKDIKWQYGPGAPVNGQFDFQTVMLHELGHAHQLGHVILPRAVMHYAIEDEALVRDLSSADIGGANLIIAQSLPFNPCGVQAMEPKLDGDCNIALEIYSFDAAFQNGQVLATWTTNKEKNIDYFVVERSADGITWEDVSTQISAEGPSTGFLDYSTTDTDPLPRISYYRIRVVYNNGDVSYSPRYRIINPNDLQKLTVYPNPVPPDNSTLFLEYIVQSNVLVHMQLYDTAGKKVRSFDVTFTDTNLPVQLDVSGLASGLYILQWQSKNSKGEVKIIKL
ncbi:T9SS type A sorting domain-containing protein [Pontibacter chitinilyticus]|uniref:T9SS type A sorting domain-containing protein n=1 Tax=Pontibacter chitinilyticus TaxID=2674989 RepID=UPI0032191771